MDMQSKDMNAHNNSPKIPRQQSNVEERRTRHSKDNRRQGVEYEQQKSVADEVPTDRTVPDRRVEGTAVEDPGLSAVDEHAPEGELADDFVHRPLRNQELFDDIADAVEGSAQQDKQVTFDFGAAGSDTATIRAGDVVACNQDAEAGAAD